MLTPISVGRKRLFFILSILVAEMPATLHVGERGLFPFLSLVSPLVSSSFLA